MMVKEKRHLNSNQSVCRLLDLGMCEVVGLYQCKNYELLTAFILAMLVDVFCLQIFYFVTNYSLLQKGYKGRRLWIVGYLEISIIFYSNSK